MIQFKELTLSDRPWVVKLLMEEHTNNADNSFTNMYAWNETYCKEVAEIHGNLVVKLLFRKTPFYAFPMGGGDKAAAINDLEKDAAAQSIPFKMRGLTEENVSQLEGLFPGKFKIDLENDTADYVYDIEKLSTMAGKKLHSKRNHINRFLKENPGWSFETIKPQNTEECREMCAKWMELHQEHGNFAGERKALEHMFDNFEALGLGGGFIRSYGKIVALAMGELLSESVYVVHVEKAFADIQGAYTIITREFSRYIQESNPKIRYINREDDLGLESLRKAKRSLHPEFMVEKFIATWKG